MSKSFRTWIYHATKEPKIISSDKFETYQKEGWADTPAKFAKIKDFGIDENNAASVQVLGEAMEGVKNRINGELNIEKMNKTQLEEFAREHFNVELDRRHSVKKLVAEVKDLIGG